MCGSSHIFHWRAEKVKGTCKCAVSIIFIPTTRAVNDNPRGGGSLKS